MDRRLVSYRDHVYATHNDRLVERTIQIITKDGDAPPVLTLSMSTPGNVTSDSSGTSVHASLLWIPYVLIALVFIVFLGANFWCYHKKHRERYLRKRDEKRVKDGLHERRRITALMRSHFQTAFMSKNSVGDFADDGDMTLAERGALVSAPQSPSPSSPTPGAEKLSSPVPSSSPPAQSPREPFRPWTSQNGSCRTSNGVGGGGGGGGSGDVVCNVKRETSNGSVTH